MRLRDKSIAITSRAPLLLDVSLVALSASAFAAELR